MELLALDANFQPVKYIRYINLQWDREYYSCGKFSVQTTADNYLPEMAYIYTPDRPETGIIQKVEVKDSIKGTFVQLEGMFLEHKMNDKVAYPTYYGNGTIEETVADMVGRYKADIPLLNVVFPGDSSSASVKWQRTGGGLGSVAYEKLATEQKTFSCLLDYENSRVDFIIWQGVDRTQDQNKNNFVTFSSGFRNLENVKASFDNSNYRNYAIVAGSGQGDERMTAVVDISSGGYKKQIFVDARSLMFDSTQQTEREYLQTLEQYGLERLLNDYKQINNIEIDVLQTSFTYLTDFDLGDMVDVIIDLNGHTIPITARVVAVHEVFKNNNHLVTIEIGDKKITSLKKARLK